MEKVSIIVPTHNVSIYIDQCIESINTQTYENLEIIIIDDASTDDTVLKCQQWKEKDDRIILLINNRKIGAGASRNRGLIKATGKYIVYVDSDDWIAQDYIKILYDSITLTHADYVSSVGYFKVDNEIDVSPYTFLPAGDYISDYDKAIILLKEAPAVWKKIYNKDWLLKNKLFQPKVSHYEDWSFEISAVFSAQKIVLIPEIGVYYRNQRDGSLSLAYKSDCGIHDMITLCLQFKKSVEYGIKQAERTNVMNRYLRIIQYYILQSYCRRKEIATNSENKKALQILDEIKTDILEKHFGYQEKNIYKQLICFGSFSLRSIAQQTLIFGSEFSYYGFSSVISAITQGSAMEIKNKNKFRVEQISKDISGALLTTLESIQEKTILFIDFLEERNSILMLEDNHYITESEIYLDSSVDNLNIKKYIPSGSPEFIDLWQKKCYLLVSLLYQKKDLLDIILIRNRMALQYGSFNSLNIFPEQESLNNINGLILKLEEIFLDQCSRFNLHIKTYSLPSQYLFTDEQFTYGCNPQYTNGALYTYLGTNILEDIG